MNKKLLTGICIAILIVSSIAFADEESVDYSPLVDAYKLEIKELKVQLDNMLNEGADKEDIDALEERISAKKDELSEFMAIQEDSNYNVEIQSFVPSSFTVQEAGPLQTLIDAAPEGSTIYLNSTTYSECVVIKKSLNIIGNNTVINGGFDLQPKIECIPQKEPTMHIMVDCTEVETPANYSFENLIINNGCSIIENISGTIVSSRADIAAANVSLSLNNVNLTVVGDTGALSGCIGMTGIPAYNLKLNNINSLNIADSSLTATGGAGGSGPSGDDCHGGYGADSYNINGVNANNIIIDNVVFTSNGGPGGNGGDASSSRKDTNDGGHGRRGGTSHNINLNGENIEIKNSDFTSQGGLGGSGGSASGEDRGGDGGDGGEAYNIEIIGNNTEIKNNDFFMKSGDAGIARDGGDGSCGDGGDSKEGVSLKYSSVNNLLIDNNIFEAYSGLPSSGANAGSHGDNCNYGCDGGYVYDISIIQGSGEDIVISNNDITAKMKNAGNGGSGSCSGDDTGGDGGDGGDIDYLIGIDSPGSIINNYLHDFYIGLAGNGGGADDGSGGDAGEIDELIGIRSATEVIGNTLVNFKQGTAGNGGNANSYSGCGSEYGGSGGEVDNVYIISASGLVKDNHIENITHGTAGNGGYGRCSSGRGGSGGDIDDMRVISSSGLIANNTILNIISTKGGTGGGSADYYSGSGGWAGDIVIINSGNAQNNIISNVKSTDGGCPGQSGDHYGYKQDGADLEALDTSVSKGNSVTNLRGGKRCTATYGQISDPLYFNDGRVACYNGGENNYCNDIDMNIYNGWGGAHSYKKIAGVTPEIMGLSADTTYKIDWYRASNTGDKFDILYRDESGNNYTIATNIARDSVCSNVRCTYTWNFGSKIPEDIFIVVRDSSNYSVYDISNYRLNGGLADGLSCNDEEECYGRYCINKKCASVRVGVKNPKTFTNNLLTWNYPDYFTGPETVDFREELQQSLNNCTSSTCTVAINITAARAEGFLNISNLNVNYEIDRCFNVVCNSSCDGYTYYYGGYCEEGQCIYAKQEQSAFCNWTDPVCYENEDCGNNGFIESTSCFENDIIDTNRQWACLNPGTPLAVCSHTDILQSINYCSFGCSNSVCNLDPCGDVNCTDYCDNYTYYKANGCALGSCNYIIENNSAECGWAPACTVKADCGTDSWIEEPYCNGEDVYSKFRTYSCTNLKCIYTDTVKMKQRCVDTCADGACTTSDQIIDTFGDGEKVKNIIYGSGGGTQTVYIRIPKDTEVKQAKMIIQGGSS